MKTCTLPAEEKMGIFSGDSSSSSFFDLAHRCMEASAEPKIPSWTMGMFRTLSFSLSDKLACSCRTMVPSTFPTVWTAQRWTRTHKSVMTGISSHVAGSCVRAKSSHNSVSSKRTLSALAESAAAPVRFFSQY